MIIYSLCFFATYRCWHSCFVLKILDSFTFFLLLKSFIQKTDLFLSWVLLTNMVSMVLSSLVLILFLVALCSMTSLHLPSSSGASNTRLIRDIDPGYTKEIPIKIRVNYWIVSTTLFCPTILHYEICFLLGNKRA